MKIDSLEISSLLKEQIKNYEKQIKTENVGSVISVGDGIALVYGIDRAMSGELLVFPNGVYGMVQNLEKNHVGAILLNDPNLVKEGDEVKTTGRILEIGVGEEMIGRIINPLGQAIDGLGSIKTNKTRPIERKATGVIDRQSVNEPLQTGIKVLDALVPIGRGQRELIIGDRQTGKTAIAVDTIINQKDKDVICIYVAIGQKQTTVLDVYETLKKHDAMDYSIIVAANASDPAPLLYLAPYAGVTIAEEFMFEGKHVLIIYDDLSKHAIAYRELSLLLRRPPGREAFPGDVFYLHSRLLERAAKLSDKLGGGSITALPIIETQEGDISAYIPTNVISITDGQIFLQSQLFHSGIRPAINAGLSVSRVGGAAQHKSIKKVSGTLRLDLASYRELEAFTQFGSDLDDNTKAKLNRGEKTVEILKQGLHSPMPFELQTISIYALTHGFLDKVKTSEVRKYESELHSFFLNDTEANKLLREMRESKNLPDTDKLDQVIDRFNDQY
ncbi:F0F1 ATP synthase subunit alpha [Hujiaoplasma nucleasis]|uniref:ATP synthase subunit alpha n=1 Tax=Hujiaoplasma nucleasis TaxID=2725268 RepID=A0A7L6N4Q3_9MOLU|nr:F0F1 ATP synthase subunit alpha [Hujiaoplasma nucleasis]QLY40257.1 F0F1 ATP synthase subunit alpha [Hujiaoplasma nucleasis]